MSNQGSSEGFRGGRLPFVFHRSSIVSSIVRGPWDGPSSMSSIVRNRRPFPRVRAYHTFASNAMASHGNYGRRADGLDGLANKMVEWADG